MLRCRFVERELPSSTGAQLQLFDEAVPRDIDPVAESAEDGEIGLLPTGF